METLEIQLVNGENLILEVTPLILEYIEDYEGGIEQLRKDASGEKNKDGYTKTMYALNQFLYAIIASNYHESLTYSQAVRLVKLEDVVNIIQFMLKAISKLKNKTVTDSKQPQHTHRL